MSGRVASNGPSINSVLAEIAKESEIDQGGEIQQGRTKMGGQQEVARQQRKDMEALEKKMQQLMDELKRTKPNFWDVFGLGNKKKMARLKGDIDRSQSETKKKQAELQKAKKAIEQELAKMKAAIDRKEETYGNLNDVVGASKDSFDATRT